MRKLMFSMILILAFLSFGCSGGSSDGSSGGSTSNDLNSNTTTSDIDTVYFQITNSTSNTRAYVVYPQGTYKLPSGGSYINLGNVASGQTRNTSGSFYHNAYHSVTAKGLSSSGSWVSSHGLVTFKANRDGLLINIKDTSDINPDF